MMALHLSQKLTVSLFLSLTLLLLSSLINVFAQSATSCFQTAVGTPPAGDAPTLPPECATNGGPGGPCQTPPNYPTTTQGYKDAIKNKWGILLIDSSFSAWDLDSLKWIWEEYWSIDCYSYLQDFKGLKIQLYNDGKGFANQSYSGDTRSDQVNPCPDGDALDADPSQYPNIFFYTAGWDERMIKTLLTHEMTHVWQKCFTNGEANIGSLPDAQAADAAAGFGSYLTTYSQAYANHNLCERFVPPNSTNEDHAETIAYFLNPGAPEVTCGNGTYPYHDGRFPNHYKLAQTGIGGQSGK